MRALPADRKPLLAATQKLISKEEKRIAKSENIIAKLEATIVSKEGTIAQAELDIVEPTETADFLAGLLEVAEQDLVDALALPENTEEQIAFKNEAVKIAKLGVKLAIKEMNIYLKQVAKLEKLIAKSGNIIDKSEAGIAKHEQIIVDAEARIALLESPFDFDQRGSVTAIVELEDAIGNPMANVPVLIGAELLPPKGKGSKRMELRNTGTIWARGLTGGDGSVAFLLELPDDVQAVDVIVIDPDRAGPYTHPELRERWGAFAPAARVTVPVADLADVQLALPLED